MSGGCSMKNMIAAARPRIHHRVYQLSTWLWHVGALLYFAQAPTFVRGSAAECPAGGYVLGGMQTLRPRASSSASFGTAFDLTPDGKWLLVGHQSAPDGGSAVLYEKKAVGWQFVKQFNREEPAADNKDQFGTGVVINDDATVLAITHTRQANSAPYTGAIQIYHKNNQAKSWPDAPTYTLTAASVTINGSQPGILLGANSRIDMSSSGRTVVVSNVQTTSINDTLTIWMYDVSGSGNWTQGVMTATNQSFSVTEEWGTAVCLSRDGQWLGVGGRAKTNTARSPSLSRAGQFNLYRWNSQTNRFPTTPTVIKRGNRTNGGLGAWCSFGDASDTTGQFNGTVVAVGEQDGNFTTNVYGAVWVYRGTSFEEEEEVSTSYTGSDLVAEYGTFSADGSTIALSRRTTSTAQPAATKSAEVLLISRSPSTGTWTEFLTLVDDDTFTAGMGRGFGINTKLSGSGSFAVVGDFTRSRIEYGRVWLPKFGEVSDSADTNDTNAGTAVNRCLKVSCVRGTCDPDTGLCVCQAGWTGKTCSVTKCISGTSCTISVRLKSFQLKTIKCANKAHNFTFQVETSTGDETDSRDISFASCRTSDADSPACTFKSAKLTEVTYRDVDEAGKQQAVISLSSDDASFGDFSSQLALNLTEPGEYTLCAKASLVSPQNISCTFRNSTKRNKLAIYQGSEEPCINVVVAHDFPRSRLAAVRVDSVSARASDCDGDCNLQEIVWRVAGRTDQGHVFDSQCWSTVCEPSATHDTCSLNAARVQLFAREFPAADSSQRLPTAFLFLEGLESDSQTDEQAADCNQPIELASAKLSGTRQIDLNVAGETTVCISGADTTSLAGEQCTSDDVEYCFTITVTHFLELYNEVITLDQILSNIYDCDKTGSPPQEPAVLFSSPGKACVSLSSAGEQKASLGDLRGSAYGPKVAFSRYLTYAQATADDRKVNMTMQIGEQDGNCASFASPGVLSFEWPWTSVSETEIDSRSPSVTVALSGTCVRQGSKSPYWQPKFSIQTKLANDAGDFQITPPAGWKDGGFVIAIQDVADNYPVITAAQCIFNFPSANTTNAISFSSKSTGLYDYDSHSVIFCKAPAGTPGQSIAVSVRVNNEAVARPTSHYLLYTCSCTKDNWDDSPLVDSIDISTTGIRFSFWERSNCEARHSIYVTDVTNSLLTLSDGNEAQACGTSRTEMQDEITWDFIERRSPGTTAPGTTSRYMIRGEHPGNNYASLASVNALVMPWIGIVSGTISGFNSTTVVKGATVTAYIKWNGAEIEMVSASTDQLGKFELKIIQYDPPTTDWLRSVFIKAYKKTGNITHDIRCSSATQPNCTAVVDHVPARSDAFTTTVPMLDYTVVPVRGVISMNGTAAGNNGKNCAVFNATISAYTLADGLVESVVSDINGSFTMSLPYGLTGVWINVTYLDHVFQSFNGLVGSASNERHSFDVASIAAATEQNLAPSFDFLDVTTRKLRLVLAQGLCETRGRFQFRLQGTASGTCPDYQVTTSVLGVSAMLNDLTVPAMDQDVVLAEPSPQTMTGYFARIFPSTTSSDAVQTAELASGAVDQQWIYRAPVTINSTVAGKTSCTAEGQQLELLLVNKDSDHDISLDIYESYTAPGGVTPTKCRIVPGVVTIQDFVSSAEATASQCLERFGVGGDCDGVSLGMAGTGLTWQFRSAQPLIGTGSNPSNFVYEVGVRFQFYGALAEYFNYTSPGIVPILSTGDGASSTATWPEGTTHVLSNVLVQGELVLGGGFSIQLPHYVPMVFLYDPPGDGSFASFQPGQTLTSEYQVEQSEEAGFSAAWSIKVGAGFKVDLLGYEVEGEGSAAYEGEWYNPGKTSARFMYRMDHTVSHVIQTARSPADNGENDMLVHLATILTFSQTKTVRFNASACSVTVTLASTLNVTKLEDKANTLVVTSIGDIISTVIPNIEAQYNLLSPGSNAAKNLKTDIDGWKAVLKEHSRRRKSTFPLKNFKAGSQLMRALKQVKAPSVLRKTCQKRTGYYSEVHAALSSEEASLEELSEVADDMLPSGCTLEEDSVLPEFGKFSDEFVNADRKTNPTAEMRLTKSERSEFDSITSAKNELDLQQVSFVGGGQSITCSVSITHQGNRLRAASQEKQYNNHLVRDLNAKVKLKALTSFTSVFAETALKLGEQATDAGGASSSRVTTETTQIAFTLSDASIGDYFDVGLFRDPVTGLPMFKTLSGKSKCPFEQSTVQRERVQIIQKTDALNVPYDQDAIISITMLNDAPSGEEGDYKISLDASSDLDGLEVFMDGAPLSQGQAITLPYAQQYKQMLTARRGPVAYDYKVTLQVASACDSDVAKQVNVTVQFLKPCPSVEWGGQLSDTGDQLGQWVISSAQNTLGLSVAARNVKSISQPYEPSPGLSNLLLQYRRLADGPSFVNVPGSTWQDEGLGQYRLISNFLPNQDGLYDVRLYLNCQNGGFSPVRSTSSARRVWVDRQAPKLARTVAPEVNGQLRRNQIIKAYFDEPVSCQSIEATLVSIETNNARLAVASVTYCRNNVVKLYVSPSVHATVVGKVLEVSISGVRDEALNLYGGNGVLTWQFTAVAALFDSFSSIATSVSALSTDISGRFGSIVTNNTALVCGLSGSLEQANNTLQRLTNGQCEVSAPSQSNNFNEQGLTAVVCDGSLTCSGVCGDGRTEGAEECDVLAADVANREACTNCRVNENWVCRTIAGSARSSCSRVTVGGPPLTLTFQAGLGPRIGTRVQNLGVSAQFPAGMLPAGASLNFSTVELTTVPGTNTAVGAIIRIDPSQKPDFESAGPFVLTMDLSRVGCLSSFVVRYYDTVKLSWEDADKTCVGARYLRVFNASACSLKTNICHMTDFAVFDAPSTPGGGGGDSAPVAVAVGVALGVVALLVGAVAGAWYYRKRRSIHKSQSDPSRVDTTSGAASSNVMVEMQPSPANAQAAAPQGIAPSGSTENDITLAAASTMAAMTPLRGQNTQPNRDMSSTPSNLNGQLEPSESESIRSQNVPHGSEAGAPVPAAGLSQITRALTMRGRASIALATPDLEDN